MLQLLPFQKQIILTSYPRKKTLIQPKGLNTKPKQYYVEVVTYKWLTMGHNKEGFPSLPDCNWNMLGEVLQPHNCRLFLEYVGSMEYHFFVYLSIVTFL